MIRNIRTLGLALMAVFAMSAVAASAASAAEYHSESATTTFTGNQSENHVFTTPAGVVKCTVAKFTGTAASKTVTSVTVTPTYEGCTLAGAAATIKTNGCTYTLQQPNASFVSGITVDCPAGAKIETIAPTCTVTVLGQVISEGNKWELTGAGTTQELDLVTTIKEKIHIIDHGTKCLGNGGAAEKTFTTASYTGKTLITGEVTGGGTHTGIWVA